jgi:hypothetical protein
VWALRSTEGSNPSLSVGCGPTSRRSALYNLPVADPVSKSQVERLGKRLVESDAPSPVDLQLLRRLLLVRSSALETAIGRVRDELALAPTSRIKNTGTILEKLRRNGGSGLKSIQDLAGMRIVGDFDRRGQDDVVSAVCDLFAGETRKPKVIDRRIEPMHGYSAVHVIVFPDDAPIEIQVRTEWQHEWAELFEKLADLVGRGIRYGEPPRRWATPAGLEATAAERRRLVRMAYQLRVTTVEIALVIANSIALVERGAFVTPDNPGLRGSRREVDSQLIVFRELVDKLEGI